MHIFPGEVFPVRQVDAITVDLMGRLLWVQTFLRPDDSFVELIDVILGVASALIYSTW